MKESEFIKTLQQRAQEQKKFMHEIPFPGIFQTISIWLGVHPWRILIPIALIISAALHFVIGKAYDDLILKIFGGFGFIKLY